ncbi:MAG: hypothetical protein ACT4QB_06060, partial [Gammaproteobacteria bacterium]
SRRRRHALPLQGVSQNAALHPVSPSLKNPCKARHWWDFLCHGASLTGDADLLALAGTFSCPIATAGFLGKLEK